MAGKGVSVSVGLNSVDPAAYGGWDGKLQACENDARAMQALCRQQGMDTVLLLGKQAQADAVLTELASCASWLEAGDLLVLTYSGHGGRVDDPWGRYGEVSTWCLFDREVISHELYRTWGRFKPGVRILVVSDSCHSGTVIRLYDTAGILPASLAKCMPDAVQQTVHARQQHYYRELFRPEAEPAAPLASVLLLGACQDNQVALDGNANGLFTELLLKVWAKGNFVGDHPAFHKGIVRRSPASQTPSYFRVGPVNATWEASKPFTLSTATTPAGTITLPTLLVPAPIPAPTPPPVPVQTPNWLAWLIYLLQRR